MGYLNLGVIGMGLIGGSIGLAGSRAGYRVIFYEPGSAPVETILSNAVRATSVAELAESSDLIFIAPTFSSITSVTQQLAPLLKPTIVVSAVARLKVWVF